MSCLPFRRLLVSIHVPLAEHDYDNWDYGSILEVSIHVPLAEHDIGIFRKTRKIYVSIHVPLAEHDQDVFHKPVVSAVSIHVPLAEHDVLKTSRLTFFRFQFTCPSRSTTCLHVNKEILP